MDVLLSAHYTENITFIELLMGPDFDAHGTTLRSVFTIFVYNSSRFFSFHFKKKKKKANNYKITFMNVIVKDQMMIMDVYHTQTMFYYYNSYNDIFIR